MRLGELQHELGSRNEPRLDIRLRRLVAQGNRQVRLANAGRPEQHYVLRSFDECQRCKLRQQRFWSARCELKVILFERLDARKSSRSGQERAATLLPVAMLGEQQLLEKLLKAQLFARGVLGDVRQVRCHRSKRKALTKVFDAFKLEHVRAPMQAHHRWPTNVVRIR